MRTQTHVFCCLRLVFFAAALSIATLGSATGVQAEPAKAPNPRVIRWLVAHDRGHNAFAEINQRFADEVEKKSGGGLKIEFTNSPVPESEVEQAAYDDVVAGRVDMSQLPASAVNVHVLDMPFVFRNYKHAEAVFASPVNKKLVAEVVKVSHGKVRGFAYTYSGGYRILAGRVPVRRLADFQGARIQNKRSYLTPFLASLGARPVAVTDRSRDRPIDDVIAGKIDLEETEVNRLTLVEEANPGLVKKIGSLSLTRHRMYVTALVANEKFFQSLSPAQRGLLTSEMEKLAVAERKLSVDLEAKNLKVLAARGAAIVEFSDADLPAFVKLGEAFRRTIPGMSELIDKIQAVKEPGQLAEK